MVFILFFTLERRGLGRERLMRVELWEEKRIRAKLREKINNIVI